MSPPTLGMLQQQIENLTGEVTENHKRLRGDLTGLEVDLAKLETEIGRHREALDTVRRELATYRATPVNVTSLTFTTPQVIAIVALVLTLVGSTGMVLARQSAMNDAVDRIQKAMELNRIQIESLTKTVLTQGQTR